MLAVRHSDEWARENLEDTGDSDTDGAVARRSGGAGMNVAVWVTALSVASVSRQTKLAPRWTLLVAKNGTSCGVAWPCQLQSGEASYVHAVESSGANPLPVMSARLLM